MKEYTVYFRHLSETYPHSHTVKCHDIESAIRKTLEAIQEGYFTAPEDIDICHVEEEK